MPKKPVNQPRREPTKRQLSHWQRESRLQRFTMLGGIILIIAVLAILGTGVYLNKLRPFQATAIKVYNASYSIDYYIDLLTFLGKANGNPQYISYFKDYAVQMIEQNYFYLKQAAAEPYKIIVSDDEVKTEIKNGGYTGNAAVSDAIRSKLLATKLKDYFDKSENEGGVSASADGKTVQAMFLESQSQVNDVTSRLNKGEKFTDIAAQLSVENISKGKSGDFGWVPQGVLSSTITTGNSGNTVLESKVFSKDTPPDTLTQSEDKDLPKNIGYWLVEITDAAVTSPTPSPTPTASPTPQVHLLAMVLGSQQQAEEIKAKLDAGGPGNDFVGLAKLYSSYTNASTDGGDLGLKSKGSMPGVVDKVVFPDDVSKTLGKNVVSSPIMDNTQTTKGGFWLLQASDTQNKAVTGDNRTTLVNNQVQTWLDKVWSDNKDKAQNLLTQDQTDFAVQQAQSRYSK